MKTTTPKITLTLNFLEASWLRYCLRYVDECYSDTDIGYSKKRLRELARGQRVKKRLEKLGAK